MEIIKLTEICRIVGIPAISEVELKELQNRQYNKGLNKYGTTLQNAGLSRTELANHAMEEIVDLLEYAKQYKISE